MSKGLEVFYASHGEVDRRVPKAWWTQDALEFWTRRWHDWHKACGVKAPEPRIDTSR